MNKSENSVDIGLKNVDIELVDVDKNNPNVDKTVYKSNKCGYTEVLVRLYTGKTHQIRVAFSHIGHPLVGDILYGAQPTGQPFQLRAQKVVFTHMRTGERITVTASSDFLKSLREPKYWFDNRSVLYIVKSQYLK